MEYTFLYEKALADAKLSKSKLPAAIQGEISEMIKLVHQLADLPDDQLAEQEKLNDQIDKVDEGIAQQISNLGTGKPADQPPADQPPIETLEAETIPNEEKKDNTGMVILGVAVVGGIVWGLLKLFGGKK